MVGNLANCDEGYLIRSRALMVALNGRIGSLEVMSLKRRVGKVSVWRKLAASERQAATWVGYFLAASG